MLRHASSDSAVSTGHVPRISRQLVRWPAAPPLKTHADAAAPAASLYEHHEQLESRRHTSHAPDLMAQPRPLSEPAWHGGQTRRTWRLGAACG